MKSFRGLIIGAILSCYSPFLLVAVAGAATRDDKKNSAVDSSVALTQDTFDELTFHKTVFVKFFAPWCSHCAELQPAWEELAVEFKNHDIALVASVDCSTHQGLCEKFHIQGLPTLLYGDASQGGVYLHEYRGEKSYAALSQFTTENLTRRMCSPANLDACEPEMRTQMERILQLDETQLEQGHTRGGT